MRKVIYIIGFLVSTILLSACSLVAWEPGGVSNELASETIPVEGGVISVDDSELKGFSILVPKAAYTDAVEFVISTEEFNPETPVEDFNPITPLIVIDNGHVVSDEGLTVTIPIDVDSETEFVMAFYYDSELDTYEAIPTLSYSDNEIELLTTHFSKIVVSKISFDKLESEIISNPETYDTGFTIGVDDLPISNYGTELEVLGHCAGQTVLMSYYYTEHKQKNKEENLYTRFDNDTPSFKTDDIAVQQLSSAIQNSINWKSSVYKKLESSITESDLNRFYSFAYAIKITKSPQYMEIRDYVTDPKKGNAHAILAYKITYEENQFRIYVADPNIPGAERYVPLTKESGFGTYRSGMNASEAANNPKQYADFFFAGAYSIVDKKQVETLYNKMISNTLQGEMFSSFVYLYKVAKDGAYIYVPLEDGSVINPIAYNGEPARMKVMIVVASEDFKAVFFRNQGVIQPQSQAETVDGVSSMKYTMLLASGETNVGIATFRFAEAVAGDSNSKDWGRSSYYNVNVNYNPFDYSSYTNQLEGEYVEVSRGSEASDWPTDRSITFTNDGTGSISWDYDSGKAEDTYWIIKEVDGKKVVEMAIKGTEFYEDYEYNETTNELTMNPGTDYYITYQKKVEEAVTYTVSYLSSIEDSVWMYSPCPEVLNLDQAWGQAILNSFSTKRLFFTVESEDESFSVKLKNDSVLYLVNGAVINGKWTVSSFLESGKTYTIIIQIYHGSVVVKEISITVNTSW